MPETPLVCSIIKLGECLNIVRQAQVNLQQFAQVKSAAALPSCLVIAFDMCSLITVYNQMRVTFDISVYAKRRSQL